MGDFYKFAEEAIEMAGKAGERKRQFKAQTASNLARSRMAELKRSESGATKRQSLIEAGKEKRHEREYGRPWGARPEAQQGFRYAELAEKRRGGLATEAGKEHRHLRQYGPESYAAQESGLRFGHGGLEERQTNLMYGPESQKAREIGLRFGHGGLEERRLEQKGIEARRSLVDMPIFDKTGYVTGTTPGIADLETGEYSELRKKKEKKEAGWSAYDY